MGANQSHCTRCSLGVRRASSVAADRIIDALYYTELKPRIQKAHIQSHLLLNSKQGKINLCTKKLNWKEAVCGHENSLKTPYNAELDTRYFQYKEGGTLYLTPTE